MVGRGRLDGSTSPAMPNFLISLLIIENMTGADDRHGVLPDGCILSHEHLVYGPPGWFVDRSIAGFDVDDIVENVVDYLGATPEYGIEALVDATPIDAGRNVEVLSRVNDRVDVEVLCATGLYPESRGITTYFQHRNYVSDAVEEMTELFVQELCHGIEGTEFRADVLKAGSSHGEVKPYDEMVLTATARAQDETGTPIITHTEGGTAGVQQAEVLLEAGADAENTVIGHIGAHDRADQRQLLELGVSIAFDQFGTTDGATDQKRMADLEAHLDAGCADQILLSQDYIISYLSRTSTEVYEAHPSWSLYHLLDVVLGDLFDRGVPESDLRTMLWENPQELFL